MNEEVIKIKWLQNLKKDIGKIEHQDLWLYEQALDEIIEALKAQKWTLCSERPPETIGEYLITVLSRPSRNAITTAGYWNERLKEFGTFRPDGTWEKWDVVAWKPLPKPYKDEGE